MTPVETAALMLVPLSVSRRSPFLTLPAATAALESVDPIAASDARRWPGATTSGLASASYHVGPRELYGATTSSWRVTVFCVITAPTVMAECALPGDVMPP